MTQDFFLALCPPDMDESSLTTLVSFALGGILGDTILHLVPEVYLGEDPPDEVSVVVVDSKRNLVLGLAVIVGFLTFVALDKALRIATGGSGHDHSHGHAEPASNGHVLSAGSEGKSTAVADLKNELKSRKSKASTSVSPDKPSEGPAPIQLSAYLNLIADFTHNITDGLAISSSFYSSQALGATTAAAVFFHEIPHEVGDLALLMKSGFSKRKAMGAQFVTALGAFCGTCIGVAIQGLGRSESNNAGGGKEESFWDSLGLDWSKLLLAWTTGSFLFVGTVSCVPDLLATGPNPREEIWKTFKQFMGIAAGVGVMMLISG